jgi:hypothetical protein
MTEPAVSENARIETMVTTKKSTVYKISTVGVVIIGEVLVSTAFVFMSLLVMVYAKAVG